MSTTGLVLSIIGIVWSAGNSLLWVWMMSTGRHVFPPYGG
jgi:hypothetical protein